MTITTTSVTTNASMAQQCRPTSTTGKNTIVNAARKNSPSHTQKPWHTGLAPGLRSALACFIVGCTTIYGPAVLRRYIKFPAFAYVTAMLIVSKATVGDSLRGATFTLYGTVMAIPPAIVSLMVIGPDQLSVLKTTLATAVSSFVVMLPASAPLITRRIALGQIVLVYVAAYKQGTGVNAVPHPLHVAASTALGFTAAVLAVLLPYPQLAYHEVKNMSNDFKNIEMERLALYISALCAEDRTSADAAISQANSKSKEAAKLLCGTMMKQGSLKWERPKLGVAQAHTREPCDALQSMDMPLKGMEIALSSAASLPIKAISNSLRDYLHGLEDEVSDASKEQRNRTIANQATSEHTSASLSNMIPLDRENIFVYFTLFCVKLLHKEFMLTHSAMIKQEKKAATAAEMENIESPVSQEADFMRKIAQTWVIPKVSVEMLIVSLKCSMATGLAVLFGILFSKDDGYWSGLTVAMAITPQKEATFKLANLRAQGTTLGSVYGVLGALISQKYMELRFLVLLPWIIFASFLRQSPMYGQAGGLTAAVSAIIILGRKNYGPTVIFAIDRLTETYIGLLCCILADIILQPTRATSLARTHTYQSIESLHECINMICRRETASSTSLSDLKEKGKELMGQMHQLKKLIKEAEGEPNFWFLPFPSSCYNKIQSSLSRMAEFIIFLGQIELFLTEESDRNMEGWHMIVEKIKTHLQSVGKVDDLIICIKHVMQVKSLLVLDKKLQGRTISDDLEIGGRSLLGSDEEFQMVLSSYLRHAIDLIDQLGEDEGKHDMKNQMFILLGACGYCVEGLMKESRELEAGILELVQFENPSRPINLYEVSCKVKSILVK